jgi:K+-transporting ATPase A subunit
VAVALIRGIVGRSGKSLGNFWYDLIRTCLYVLLPLAIIGAIVLISQGAIQNFTTYLHATGLTSGGAQTIAMGPVASQSRRSRSSGPTVAASSTSTPRTRSRIRRASRTCSRCCGS